MNILECGNIDTGWRTGKNGRFNIYWNKKKTKLSKSVYGRLAHTINTYPTKWEKGINSQVIGNKKIRFNYKGYDNFDIIEVKDYE